MNRYVIGRMLLSSLSGRKRLLEELERNVKGLSVSGVRIEIAKDFSIVELFEALNEYGRFIIAFDEAQYLRFGGATRYDGILAYAVDNLENLTFILTGSEVGMLFDFLRFDDPRAPIMTWF